jgi:acylphosphatase
MSTESHIVIRGFVQGVGFRMYAQRQARKHGVTGYVRNLSNGDVEIVAQGEAEAVARLIDWARQGPPSAQVDEVAIQERPPSIEFGSFDIR